MSPLLMLVLVALFGRAHSIGQIAVTYVGGDNQQEIIANFNKWMDDNGGKSWSKVEVSYIEGFRLGLLAREDIAEGEVYLAVPWHMLIHSESIRSSHVGQEFAALQKKYKLNIFHELMLFFLHELNNPDSFWKPFLDILPASHNTPIHWSDEELAELKGTPIPEAVQKYRKEARKNFEQDKAIMDENPELFDIKIREALDYERYLWASSTLDSRTIWIDGRYRSFLPILDMANNKDHPTKAHRTSRNPTKDSTETHAIWAVAKGEQVFENYNTPNYENLLYHGFTLDKNIHDNTKLSMPMPAKEYHQTLGRVGARPVYNLNKENGLAPEMLAHARVVSLDASEMRRYQKTDFHKKVNLANEKRALQFLKNVLEQKLKTYATSTIDEDKEILGDQAISSNRRTAVTYRLQQKEHVLRCLEQINSLVGPPRSTSGKPKRKVKRKRRAKEDL